LCYGRAPEDVVYDHRHAHPEFRNPLSSADDRNASVEFHAAVIERLAADQPITLLTFDSDSEWQGERTFETSDFGGLVERDLAWSVVEPPAEGATKTPGLRPCTSS
jgi:hypothetical protein